MKGNNYRRILEVDLTTGSIEVSPLPLEYIRDYIGGRGLGARLLWDMLKQPAIDPLSPSNVILFMPGPFSGLPIPSSTRTTVVTKSPNTVASTANKFRSTISYSNIGGHIGPAIRRAGYSGIAIKGRADKLSALVIDDESVRIEAAEYLRGKRTEETKILLQQKLGSDFRLCYIGPAGEKESALATIMTTGSSAAGRGGTGGVMGSKNLKAIAIRGTGLPHIGNEELYKQLISSIAVAGNSMDNHSEENPCSLCSLDCRKGGYSKGPSKSIESSSGHSISKMMGRIVKSDDLALMSKMVDMADDWGVDIISSAAILSVLEGNDDSGRKEENNASDRSHYLLELFRIICESGLVPEFFYQLVEKNNVQVTGNTLSLIPRIKGHEFAAFRPSEEYRRWAISYATSNRGSCHTSGNTPERQDENAMIDSIGSCTYARGFFGTQISYTKYLEAITGFAFSEEELYKTGERVYTLERMFNIREGFTRNEDSVPGIADMDILLEEYYQKRGWDTKTGIPPSNLLTNLGIGFTNI